jgi:uncharacterized membrane protein
MNAPAQNETVPALTGLFTVTLLTAGVALVQEGPHYDNVIDGWGFFTIAFFTGALVGFLGWTRASGITPAFKFSGAHRYPWLAAMVLALAVAAAASYFNRTFSTPTERSITGEIHSVEEGKGERWHVTVIMPNGLPHRYLIPKDAAAALKNAKEVRMSVARGALGLDYIARFEPAKR